MISQNLLDQLARINCQNQPKNFIFHILFRFSKFDKDMQKSIIELQGIVTFLITDFFLLFWYLL